MANPTTNYGWPMPTSTDLVTDLPADFALFGQPVDTSLKALNPETTLGDIAYRSSTSNTNTRLGIGTNGQVLAVSSGVPAWATTADVTPLTTKGDVFTFSTVDARIGVGANNTVLTADSAEATGLKWAAVSSGLTLINTTTFSGASSVAVDGIFTSTYPNYFIQTNFTSATGTDQMVKLRVRAGGTAYTGGDYDTIGNRSYPGAVIGFGGFATAWELHNITASSGDHSHNTIQLLSPQTASVETKITSFGFGYTSVTYTTNSIHMSGYLQNSAQYDGFIMFVTTGNIAGTVKIYGYAN